MIANPFTFANNQLETSSNGTQIIVYPNPLKQNSVATLSIELTEPASVQVDVFNTLGSKVASPFVQSNLSASSHTISINSKNLRAGSYVIRTLVDGIAITKQLVIK